MPLSSWQRVVAASTGGGPATCGFITAHPPISPHMTAASNGVERTKRAVITAKSTDGWTRCRSHERRRVSSRVLQFARGGGGGGMGSIDSSFLSAHAVDLGVGAWMVVFALRGYS